MYAMQRFRNTPKALSTASGGRNTIACSSSNVFAQFLASLYNGYRVKADVSDIGTLDSEYFEHLMNVLRLCYITQRKPHTFIDNGSEEFEGIISLWGMEKKSND